MIKYNSVLLIALLFAGNIAAQSKNPTSNKEVQDKIKQAQQQFDKLTPEQKKMMEQMGMSTNVPSMPAGVTDAQIGLAVGGDEVPKRNATLIGAIPKITLTAATVPAYIKTLNEYIEKGVANDVRIFGQQVYSGFKQNKFDAASIGNAAIGYWSIGNPDIAVYLMGRACADDPSDADLLSNFAAMMSMGGAPHKAIPLLEYLNKEYPDNTTILNNLGQAWFYLGEVDKANANLDKVVKAFAYHPQANYTQCLIQESRGNKTGAIEKMKSSLAYNYSLDKVNKLRKLGYSVKGSDMRIPFRPDPDPLGLRKFVRPDAPASYEQELKLSVDWDAFQKQVNEKSMSLAKELLPYQQANNQEAQQNYKKFNNKSVDDILKMKASPVKKSNLYEVNAQKNLEAMNKDGGVGYRLNAAKKQIDDLKKDFTAKDEAQRKTIEKQNSIKAESETELAKKGENIGFDNCVVQKKYSEWVYANYNKPLEEAYKNYLHQLYLKINEELYWKQFTQDAPTFEATKIAAKKEWLAALGNTRYLATNKYGKCETPEQKPSRYKLADFDEMHCNYTSVLDFGVYKQIVECGKMRVEFDAGKLSGNFNFKAGNNGKDEFVKGNLEATVIDKSVSVKKGPLQIGANVKAGMGVEFTNKGISDVYATGEASVSVKSNIIETFDQHISEANGGDKSQPGMGDAQLSDKGVEIGVNGRMSLISGNTSTNIFVKTPN
ncbi:MAG: hypothetical protein IPO46_12390 [Chitinophagaceae bacterium]|jgi:hypothetical protein|nr:hypothetical protein [Chitinophagaceae bacterium]MBP6371144.1 hypothetical protein [Ferruginibacter sp.]NMD29526.1 hypothetical protein [Bacteroidota bacterium]MBK7346359.1 hypothetical protein [Chitinophagaceae bacterium]MBK9959158.1 hypothetical protein [Chitinophagaceae bacterium]